LGDILIGAAAGPIGGILADDERGIAGAKEAGAICFGAGRERC
jgi:hypothetical protein